MDPVTVLKAYADQRGLVDPFADEYAENAWKSFQETKRLPNAGTAREKALKAFVRENQLPDPWTNVFISSPVSGMPFIIEPTYNPWALGKLPSENDTLGPCIEAKVKGVCGYGHAWTYVGPKGKQTSKDAKDELNRLRALIEYPNADAGIRETLTMADTDYETFGSGYLEVGRDRATGEVTMVAHLPSPSVRKTTVDSALVSAMLPMPSTDGTVTMQRVFKRFRRYVQQISTRRVFFNPGLTRP